MNAADIVYVHGDSHFFAVVLLYRSLCLCDALQSNSE